jgi:hypothetical protein
MQNLPIIQKTYDLIKWYVPILNRLPALLPPLIPPYKGGKQGKSSSLPFIRGGLGRGKKYLIHRS